MVENRAGAGGNVGADIVAKSAGDGYTLLLASGAIATNPHIYKNMPFDTQKDLVPITNVASGPMLLVVPDDSPAKSVKDLIAMAKAKPGTVNFGSAGVGSQTHLAAENFAYAAGIDIVHVPYKGEAPAYTDLIGGRSQMMVGNFAAASALLRPGPAARARGHRQGALAPLPDVPTAAESGLPGFENAGWFGLFAPAGTPRDILAKIQRDTRKVLAATELQGASLRAGHGAGGQHAGRVRDDNGRGVEALGDGGQGPQAQRELRRRDRHEDRSPGRRGRGEGALHPRAEDAAARHQERLRPLAAPRNRRAPHSRCSPRWSTNIARRRADRQPALPGHRHADLQRRRSAAASRSTAHALKQAIRRGCERATREYPLRSSVVHPLTRKNEHTSCGIEVPPIHIDFSDRPDLLEIEMIPKGSGSENNSFLKMAIPAEGIDAIKTFVIDCVLDAGGKTCPPTIVGVGLGGTSDLAVALAKRAATRALGSRCADPEGAALEAQLSRR